jgi:hypothetical protein
MVKKMLIQVIFPIFSALMHTIFTIIFFFQILLSGNIPYLK